uniref:Reverse transcriptase domain-containing protein n=1 Tax=Tanacetum cinerariifolium TaxID=118510 RepID=A0A6L2MKS4_TANCI|nr:reverse transcriptase domain-containing protein [Tanacetum cinerariifolium]
MTHLLEKNSPFIFLNDCIQAFRTLKENLTETPILIAPNWDKPFEIMCDASDYAVGAVLGASSSSATTTAEVATDEGIITKIGGDSGNHSGDAGVLTGAVVVWTGECTRGHDVWLPYSLDLMARPRSYPRPEQPIATDPLIQALDPLSRYPRPPTHHSQSLYLQ